MGHSSETNDARGREGRNGCSRARCIRGLLRKHPQVAGEAPVANACRMSRQQPRVTGYSCHAQTLVATPYQSRMLAAASWTGSIHVASVAVDVRWPAFHHRGIDAGLGQV